MLLYIAGLLGTSYLDWLGLLPSQGLARRLEIGVVLDRTLTFGRVGQDVGLPDAGRARSIIT